MEQIRQPSGPAGAWASGCCPAALAAVFTVSAMAAYHLWAELFDLHSERPADGQKELLDQIGAQPAPVTSNGVTLTGRHR